MTFTTWATSEDLEMAIDAYTGIAETIRVMTRAAVDGKAGCANTWGREIKAWAENLADIVARYRVDGGTEAMELILSSIRAEAKYTGIDCDKVTVEIIREMM